MANRAVIRLNLVKTQQQYDIDVPLDINASELMEGLNEAYGLGLPSDAMADCYVKAENPIVLMHGKKTLEQYGVMNGSVINITD